MKQKLFLLFVLISSFMQSQQHIDTGVASQTNTVFSLLEKNRVPYGILLDYGYDFVSIPNYDGVLRNNNYITPSIYRNLYVGILSSRTTTSVPELEAPDNLESGWKTKQKSEAKRVGAGSAVSTLVLNGLYYKYARFRSDALATNKIQVVNNKYDDVYVNGTWQNPYETDDAFAITLPVKSIPNSTVSLMLHPDNWYTNQSSSIENFAVNFGDGSGYKTLSMGTPLVHTYSIDGNFTVTYRMRLTSGQYLYCRNKLNVEGVAKRALIAARNPNCHLDTEVVPAKRAYQGVYGSATLQVAYANTCNEIRKPLIVAEGLDTGLFGPPGRIGDTDYRSFDFSVAFSGSIELQNLITNNTSDYDIIYVNWDNGTDYLQRNAYVLEAVIKWVNDTKIGNTPNVVLGQSMGGVIARYALRDMENRGEDHETSLYISHDAPHQGAHVPPGFLYMARHVLNEIITTPIGGFGVSLASGEVPVQDARQLIDQPAVRQLLINYVNSSYQIDNNAHSTWQNELKNMGYPRNTRNISLSNASHCASSQGYTSNQRLFRLHGSGGTSPFTDIVLSLTGLGGIVGDAFDDTSTLLLGFLPGSANLSSNFEVKAFPSSGTANIYKGSITYKKNLLWVVPVTRTITSRSFNSTAGSLFLDNFPGGINPTGLNSSSGYVTNFFGGYQYNLEVNLDFNFIPATSALDVGSGNTALTATDYLKVYTKDNPPTGNKAIPFHNFTTSYNTSAMNEPHISFSARSGNWLANELNGVSNNIFNCSYTCQNTVMTGPNNICSSATFSVSLPPNTNVNWSVNPSNALSFTQGSPTTTFTRKSNFNGVATITLKVTSPNCDRSLSVSKSVEVGKTVPGSVSGTNGVCAGEDYYYYCNVPGGHKPWYTYRWTMPNSSWQIYLQNQNTILAVPYGSNFAGQIIAEVNNGCGWSVVGGLIAYPYCPGTYSYNVYPNPNSSGLFTVDIIDVMEKSKDKSIQLDSSDDQTNELAIEVYNFTGNIVKPKEIIQNGSQVDVSGLHSGIYILKIHHNGEIVEKKIMIEY